jgi:hypothetical protein
MTAHFRRRAFYLLELVVIMAALQVFLAIVVGLLWAAIRVERSTAADFERTLIQGHLADQFRTDVAGATAAEIPADLRRVVLVNPGAPTISYDWDGEKLQRSAGASRQILPLGVEQAGVEFIRTADGRLVTLRLSETRGPASARRTERIEITAALGGDVR